MQQHDSNLHSVSNHLWCTDRSLTQWSSLQLKTTKRCTHPSNPHCKKQKRTFTEHVITWLLFTARSQTYRFDWAELRNTNRSILLRISSLDSMYCKVSIICITHMQRSRFKCLFSITPTNLSKCSTINYWVARKTFKLPQYGSHQSQ